MPNIISRLAFGILGLLFTMLKAITKIAQDLLTCSLYGSEKVTLAKSLYDLTDKDMDGNEVAMSSFKNSVLLFVNVASN